MAAASRWPWAGRHRGRRAGTLGLVQYRTSNKWLDRSHPQTLYIATILLYVNAVFWLLDMLMGDLFAGVLAVAAVLAGIGLANEKKPGYWLALAVAGLNLLFLLFAIFVLGGSAFTSISLVINVLFAVALMALLLHPMTRNYARIWFKGMSPGPRRR